MLQERRAPSRPHSDMSGKLCREVQHEGQREVDLDLGYTYFFVVGCFRITFAHPTSSERAQEAQDDLFTHLQVERIPKHYYYDLCLSHTGISSRQCRADEAPKERLSIISL